MRIHTAVVGLGWWGAHIVGKIRSSDKLALAATVDADPAAGADTTRLEDVLTDPTIDAVVLCIPHSSHEAAIIRAADAGKHVFCEKPLTLDAASAGRAVAACRRSGVVLGVGHERRFEEPMQRVRRQVADGQLGTILYAEAAMHHDRFLTLPADHWRGSELDAPAAGMTAMGIHLTDALISMLGAVDRPTPSWLDGCSHSRAGTWCSAQLTFRNGAIGSISAVSATPFYGRLAVFGSLGWAEIRDDDHPERGLGATLTTCLRGGEPHHVHIDNSSDSVLANLESFADAVGGGRDYAIPEVEILHNVAVLDAIVQSRESRLSHRTDGCAGLARMTRFAIDRVMRSSRCPRQLDDTIRSTAAAGPRRSSSDRSPVR